MSISASQVKELRDKTGAGMMDCKKALTEANGDFEKAIEILRKKGASVAAKRAERSANEGTVLTRLLDEGRTGVMVEVNCETDFVANSDDFVEFGNTVLDVVCSKKPADEDELLKLNGKDLTIQEELTNLIGKIGEKIEISRFVIDTVENGKVVDYVHHGSKLGVLLAAESVENGIADKLEPIMKDIAMQVAAMKPGYMYREEVSKDEIEKELDIYKEVARKEGKPEQVIEKIAQGKLNKFYEETCLFEQSFVKDNSKSVSDLMAEFNKENGTQVKLKFFRRFHLSDEKK